MNGEDFIYGCRSGIQKAVRRGDLDLAHTCFSALWEGGKTHHNWIKWRVYTLAVEEAWQMCGELASLIESETTKKADWRRFIYRLTVATKSKDAVALWGLVEKSGPRSTLPNHPEFDELRWWIDVAFEDFGNDVLQLPDPMFNHYNDGTDKKTLTDYEKGALRMMHKRAKMGGMIVDRHFCIAAMSLLFLRGVKAESIEADVKRGARAWTQNRRGRRKPRTVNLPWYVFDKHTHPGKIALTEFARTKSKKYKISKQELWRLWFHMESAKTPKYLLRIPKSTNHLSCFDSAWWIEYVSKVIPYDKKSAKAAALVWRTTLRAEVEKVVNQILEGR